MGYYTDYTIVQASEEAKEYIRQRSGYNWDYNEGLFCVKWYNCLEDLEEVSTVYPDETVILDGVGEEYPDIWRAYARDGKVEVVKAKITFDKPDGF